MAEKAGALLCAAPDDAGVAALERALGEASNGLGADHVLLAAGGATNGPVELAARLARDRARVVDIGKSKLDLPWNAYYEKELDVRFSRSYGPGRYDDRYELEGIDYPVGYVRWTERRNLECFLDLLAREQIDLSLADRPGLPDRRRDRGLPAAGVRRAARRGLPVRVPGHRRRTARGAPPADRADRPGHAPPNGRPGRARRCGSGSSAPATTRPRCCCRTWPRTTTWCWRTSPRTSRCRPPTRSAGSASRRSRPTADAVLERRVARRGLRGHPAQLARRPDLPRAGGRQGRVRGEAAGADREEIDQVLDVVAAVRPGNDRLLVGFNRRFAPLLTDLRYRFGQAGEPGDGCATWSTPAGWTPAAGTSNRARGQPVRRRGRALHRHARAGGSTAAGRGVRRRRAGQPATCRSTLRFENGSTGTLSYVTGGNSRFPKETLDLGRRRTQRPAGQLPAGSAWSGRRPVASARPRRHRQGPARRAGAVRRPRSAAGTRCRSRSSR